MAESNFAQLCADLPSEAEFTVPADFHVDTHDHEDHTFSGIMFAVSAKEAASLPVKFIEIQSVWVRGGLGEMSVYYSPDGFISKETSPEYWNTVASAFLPPSMTEYKEIKFSHPIRMPPNSLIGLYIHSKREGDEAIVYGDKHANVTHEDVFLKVLPGIAHIDNVPFSSQHPWGFPWRNPRQFVGKLSYGVKYFLWSPGRHLRFPRSFRCSVLQMLLCHSRGEATISKVPKDVVMHILNMCSWDWFGELETEEMDIDEEQLKEDEYPERRYFGLGWEDFVLALARGHIQIVEADDEEYLPEEDEE